MAARPTSPFPGLSADTLLAAWDALTGRWAAVAVTFDGALLGVDSADWPLAEGAAEALRAEGTDPTLHFSLTLADLWAVHTADASRFGSGTNAARNCPLCSEHTAQRRRANQVRA